MFFDPYCENSFDSIIFYFIKIFVSNFYGNNPLLQDDDAQIDLTIFQVLVNDLKVAWF